MNKFTNKLIRLACALLLALVVSPCLAQTDAERASEIRNDIAKDEARLEQLRKDLVIQEQRFEDSNSALSDLLAQEKALQLALESETTESETTESDEGDEELRADLEDQLAGLSAMIAQESQKADLVFQSLKAGREEIRLLELGLEQEIAALNKFLGTTEPASGDKEIIVSSPSPRELQEKTPPVQSPVSSLIPGAQPVQAEYSNRTSLENISLSKSAAQIQARITAERMAARALEAEVLLNDAVERKQALESQIAIEKSQVELADQSLQVLLQEAAVIQAEIDAGLDSSKGPKPGNRLAEIEARVSIIEAERDQRTQRLSDLSDRLDAYENDVTLISRDVDIARKKAARARTRYAWIDSAANPGNLLRWAKERGPGILVVLLIMSVLLWLIRFFARRIIRVLVRSAQTDQTKRELRADTLANSLTGVLMGVVVVIAFMVVMQEAGVDMATVLGGAAIIGVAVAFGAQNLMKDIFNGVMILWEDQYGLSDLVEINGVSGKVERVTMRTTVLRDIEGQTHFIPNGMITHVTNRSYEWSRAMLDVPVPYDCDIDRAMEILLDEANAFCEDMNYTTAVSDKPVMLGVNEFAESSITIRFYIKTAAYMQMPVRREMLRRIKNRFDQEGIEIPFPHRVMINKG